jgi:hypothetical protein
MLSLYTDQGDIKNVVARNNTFRDMAPSSYYGVQWVDTTAGFTCSSNKFLDNTYTPNAPNAWTPNAPPRFECAAPSSGAATQVSGNTFQTGPPSTQCSASRQSPNWTIWSNNTFQLGGSC